MEKYRYLLRAAGGGIKELTEAGPREEADLYDRLTSEGFLLVESVALRDGGSLDIWRKGVGTTYGGAGVVSDPDPTDDRDSR